MPRWRRYRFKTDRLTPGPCHGRVTFSSPLYLLYVLFHSDGGWLLLSADVAGNVNITGSASGPRVVKGLSTGSLVGKDLIPASPPENFYVFDQFSIFSMLVRLVPRG